MIRLQGMEELRFPSPSDTGLNRSHEPGCDRCAAHRPGPQPDGNLRVDPEIHLPDVKVSPGP